MRNEMRAARGKSTGPRTAEGFDLCQRANWKHGKYSRKRWRTEAYGSCWSRARV